MSEVIVALHTDKCKDPSAAEEEIDSLLHMEEEEGAHGAATATAKPTATQRAASTNTPNGAGASAKWVGVSVVGLVAAVVGMM